MRGQAFSLEHHQLAILRLERLDQNRFRHNCWSPGSLALPSIARQLITIANWLAIDHNLVIGVVFEEQRFVNDACVIKVCFCLLFKTDLPKASGFLLLHTVWLLLAVQLELVAADYLG